MDVIYNSLLSVLELLDLCERGRCCIYLLPTKEKPLTKQHSQHHQNHHSKHHSRNRLITHQQSQGFELLQHAGFTTCSCFFLLYENIKNALRSQIIAVTYFAHFQGRKMRRLDPASEREKGCWKRSVILQKGHWLGLKSLTKSRTYKSVDVKGYRAAPKL